MSKEVVNFGHRGKSAHVPTHFERLAQAVDARAAMVARARWIAAAHREPNTIYIDRETGQAAVVSRGFVSPDLSRRDLDRDADAGLLAKAIVFLAVTGSTAGLISACGGGSDAQDQRTPTGNVGTPTPEATASSISATPLETPQVTEIPTVVPTPEPTEAPELFGQPPTNEELKTSLDDSYKQLLSAGAPSLEKDYLDVQYLICTGQDQVYPFSTTDINDAAQIVNRCIGLANAFKTMVKQLSADPEMIRETVTMLGKVYVAGVKHFTDSGVFSESDFSDQKLQSDIKNIFTIAP